MAEKKQQPASDDGTPSAPGTNPALPGTEPRTGTPAQSEPTGPTASAAAWPEDEPLESLFTEPPLQDDLFVAGSLAPAGARGPAAVLTRPVRSRMSERLSAFYRPWRRLSRLQQALVVSILLIAMAVVYVLVTGTAAPASLDRVAAARAEAPTPTATGEEVAGRPRLSTSEEDPRGRESRPMGEPSATRRGDVPRVPSVAAQAGVGEPPREETAPTWDRDPQTRTNALGVPGRPRLSASEEDPRRTLPGPEPLSLQLANKLYRARDFEPALPMYDKLYRRLPTTEENQPLRDFLLLRMALCQKNSDHAPEAESLFRTVSLSRLPVLRALARYHQGTLLLGRKRYLEAAAKAYQTAALIEVVGYDPKWVAAVEQQCGFVVAEAMTRHLLSLRDADANLPRELWGAHPDIDPFLDLEEPQLRAFLASGLETLEAAVLSPQIRKTDGTDRPTSSGAARDVPRLTSDVPSSATAGRPTLGSHWSVVCNGAPVEELLARFAADAGVNIRWTATEPAAPAEDNVRVRPVYLYLTAATAPQVIATAAGSVGLIAQNDGKGAWRLLDPTSYSSLAEHTNVLTEEAVTLWQRFLLLAENDLRVPNAHFATALLQATRGQFDQASAEYKLVANQYARHPLAPHALFQSGLLKVRLRDYLGAHADLKQLLELYPESELSDRAGLRLAEATMKAGLYEEAVQWYRKVYSLGLSGASQAQAALGAGRCLYETKQYEEAAKWLGQYTTLAPDQSRPDFSAACLLLGKTYLALHQPQPAQAALHLAIKGDLSHQQHVETIVTLVRTCLEQGLYLQALNTLEITSGWQLSQQESTELMLLRAQAFRALGLSDKAAALLEAKTQYLPSRELQGKVALELAQCQLEAGHLEAARKTLSQAFAAVEPGPLADQIGRALADVCVRLDQTTQAVSVCSQLLERAAAAERPSLLALLTAAYRKEGKYEQAVAALLDRYGTAAPSGQSPATPGQNPESIKDH